MFLFYVLRFFKKGGLYSRGDIIQGRTLYKGGHYLRKYGMYMYLLEETNLTKDESLLYGCLPRSSQCNILDESKGAHETLEFRPKFQRMIHHYQGEIEFYSKKVGYQNTCSSSLLYKNKVGKGLTNHSCKRL